MIVPCPGLCKCTCVGGICHACAIFARGLSTNRRFGSLRRIQLKHGVSLGTLARSRERQDDADELTQPGLSSNSLVFPAHSDIFRREKKNKKNIVASVLAALWLCRVESCLRLKLGFFLSRRFDSLVSTRTTENPNPSSRPRMGEPLNHTVYTVPP